MARIQAAGARMLADFGADVNPRRAAAATVPSRITVSWEHPNRQLRVFVGQ